ncbi:MAG TPA: SxtJ family membrane protein [Candidatus Acidoferrum sp.]|nr:SxtJ family membrane protein [Candidatus Acidoferrum sp.]
MRETLRALWEAWKIVAHAIGKIQARVVFSLLYIVLLGPVAVVLRLVADPLRHRHPPTSNWRERSAEAGDPWAAARRQF